MTNLLICSTRLVTQYLILGLRENLSKKQNHIRLIWFIIPASGMRLVSIACSNVRLAPHPALPRRDTRATTQSKHMDYLLLMEGCFGSERCYSERLILRENQPYFTMRGRCQGNRSTDYRKSASCQDSCTCLVKEGDTRVPCGVQGPFRMLVLRLAKPLSFGSSQMGQGALYQGFSRRGFIHVECGCVATR